MGRRTNILCLLGTVLITLATTVIVGVVVLSDYWENIKYSQEIVDDLVQKAGGNMNTELLFEGKVIVVKNKTVAAVAGATSPAAATNSTNSSSSNNNNNVNNAQVVREVPVELLVQMHGGLWSLCKDLTDEQHQELTGLYPHLIDSEKCLNLLKEQEKYLKLNPYINSRQIRKLN